MSEIQRDLASIGLWRESLERSLRRRALAPIARKRDARRKRTSIVVGAAVAAAPVLPSVGAASASSAPRKSDEHKSGHLDDATDLRILLRRGDVSPAVADAQRALDVQVDEIFGPQTEGAVRALQARAGLRVTGKVDVKTWLTLFPNDAIIAVNGTVPTGAGAGAQPAAHWAAVTVPPSAGAPAAHPIAAQASRTTSQQSTRIVTAAAGSADVVTAQSNGGSGEVGTAVPVSQERTAVGPAADPAPAATLTPATTPVNATILAPATSPTPGTVAAPGATGGQPIQIKPLAPGASGSAAELIAQMIAAANAIDGKHYAYRWGGGHNASFSGPYDCSGTVSAVLHAAGLLSAPMVSGDFMRWGAPGAGAVTIYANASHVYMSINGRFFGTSYANAGGGAGWFQGSARPGFVVVHVPFEQMHLRSTAARAQAAKARRQVRQQAATTRTAAGSTQSVAATPAAGSGNLTAAGGTAAPAPAPQNAPISAAPPPSASSPAAAAPATGTPTTEAPSAATPAAPAPAAPAPAGNTPAAEVPSATAPAAPAPAPQAAPTPVASVPAPATSAPSETVPTAPAPAASAPAPAASAPAPVASAPAPAASAPAGVVDSGSATPAPAAPTAPSTETPAVDPGSAAATSDPPAQSETAAPVSPDPSSTPASSAPSDTSAPAPEADQSAPAAEAAPSPSASETATDGAATQS